MTTSPVTSNAATAAPQTSSAAQASLNGLGDPSMFLKLLVAQLANQDPEQPSDGTAFVTQLATFAGVGQQSQMRADLDAISAVAQKYASGPAAASGSAPATSSSH